MRACQLVPSTNLPVVLFLFFGAHAIVSYKEYSGFLEAFVTTSFPSSTADHDRPTLPGRAFSGNLWHTPIESLEQRSVPATPLPIIYTPPPITEAQTVPPEAATTDVAEVVVRLLGSGRDADEACRVVCQQYGYEWEQARQFVYTVAMQQRVRIARRQAPFLLLLGFATLIGGLALLALGLVRLRTFGMAVYSPYYYRNMIMALVSGTLMVAGAGIGLVQVFDSIRK